MGSLAFDRIAARYDETRGGLERGARLASVILPMLRGPRAVEVGVGTGAVALPLSHGGIDVVGFDLSPPMVAQAYGRLGARVAVADAHSLPLPDRSVDSLLFVWVLHVVADVAAVLRECARALVVGGRVVVCVGGPRHDDGDEIAEIVEPLEAFRSPDDEPSRVIELAAGAGLAVTDDQHTPWMRFREAPSARADLIEARAYSMLWELDDETWERSVVPVVERLRALPEADRPRRRAHRYRVIALELPG